MADFVLGRLKFTFLGAWTPSYSYIKDDIVRYGGQSYACIANHTSQPSSFGGGFYTDFNSGYWSLIAGGFNFTGAWTANTQYNLNDVVTYGADSYVVTTQHVSGNINSFAANSANFTIMAGGLEFKNNYSNTVNYSIGDLVTYGGYSYVAVQNNINIVPVNNTSSWSVVTTGYTSVGTYNNSTAYVPGQVVNYGAYTYVNLVACTGQLPSNGSYWSLVSKGTEYLGTYNSGTAYVAGDVVQFGGNTYIAKTETTGTAPTTANTTQWSTYTTGVNFRGVYSAAVQYNAGDLASFGGNTWIALTSTTGTAPTPANTTQWTTYSQGFAYIGTYSSGTTYQYNQLATYANNVYISVSTNNTGNQPDVNPSSWSVFLPGSPDNVLQQPGDLATRNISNATVRLPVGANGQILVVAANGTINWEANEPSANVYYVSPNGTDTPGNGTSLQRPWKTIQYACQQISSIFGTSISNATIMLKAGTFTESNLPIVVPAGVSIVGDSTRTTFVQPAPAWSGSGNTLFQLSDSTMLTHFTMKGMTGFIPGTGANASVITAATLGGVYLAFNPVSPIVNKSPYINDVSAFSTGGVGAVIDGSIHTYGNKSMLFHSYTNIQDGGVGIYATNKGRAEIVSCFTYFCYFGYTTSNGGVLRALNGNNSYGTYGAVSNGYDPTEVPITANVYGEIINYTTNTLTPNGSTMTANNTLRGLTSGASAIILSHQPALSQIFINRNTAQPFANNEVIAEYTAVSNTLTGISANTITAGSGPENGEYGVIVTVANTSNTIIVGSSVNFLTAAGNTGYDPYYYVVSAVSTWGSASNTAIVTLASAKPITNPTANNQGVQFRNNYSQIRLTGHDFLSIGVGGIANSGYPNVAASAVISTNQVIQNYPGRVYYVATDQSGNFNVGQYFAVNQATGAATLNASSFNLSGLTSLRLGSIGAQLGAQINEFSTDGTMSQNSDVKVPTQHAVVTYVGTQISALAANTTSLAYGQAAFTTANSALTAAQGYSLYGANTAKQNSFTATNVFSGNSSALGMTVTNIAETATVSGSAVPSSVTYYTGTQSVLFYNSNATTNWSVNFAHSSGTSLNSALGVGQSITVALLATQGGTAYYQSSNATIDGTSTGVSTQWSGGGPGPTKGNANGIDVYTFTIIKTASTPSYQVLATQSQF